ncbi:cellulose synthase catalytic subunit [Escherichia coli]|uniref:Cellulose synthase catalytic subunit n=1 Tax=Escherichia coli TaxID=562 RepID=A0A377ALL5_ECOLX|nr:cellulose synthase catalytic subunit [Escherichia coli]
MNLLLKRGQQEYVFPTQVARVMVMKFGLKLMPLTTQQHIDLCSVRLPVRIHGRSGRTATRKISRWESLLDILKLGFRGYRHLAEFAPSSVKGIFRVLTSLVSWVVSFIPRRPERSETAQNHRIRLWLNNDDNAMKRKLFWICAVAMGMSAFPSFMTQATPATQPLINAEPAVAAQTEQNPQVGQVMPGVQGR